MVLPGANRPSYTLGIADLGLWIKAAVTPRVYPGQARCEVGHEQRAEAHPVGIPSCIWVRRREGKE